MTVPMEDFCDCGRHRYKDGIPLVVEAAIDPSGASPFHEDLRAMRSSRNRAIVDRAYDIEERLRQLALFGKLDVPHEMRQLRGDLWEIKTAEDRVPYYDRPASGHKRAARLAFIFGKSKGKTAQGKTPQKHINRGQWIIKGDQERG